MHGCKDTTSGIPLDGQELDRLQAEAQVTQREIIKRVAGVTLAAVVASLLITCLLSYLLAGNWLPDAKGLTIAALAPLLIAPCASYLNISLSYRLRLANERLRALSETDPLTGTLNRRSFVEAATRELSLAQRHCLPTSIVLMDFDHFKEVNDRYGHAAGDQALVHAIEIIRGVIRESDVLARFGGEEFILLLPHTAQDGAQSLSSRILREVQRTPIDLPEAQLSITLSAGSVTCETSETPLDLMMSRADELLYKSKQLGRNRCTAETLLTLARRTLRA